MEDEMVRHPQIQLPIALQRHPAQRAIHQRHPDARVVGKIIPARAGGAGKEHHPALPELPLDHVRLAIGKTQDDARGAASAVLAVKGFNT